MKTMSKKIKIEIEINEDGSFNPANIEIENGVTYFQFAVFVEKLKITSDRMATDLVVKNLSSKATPKQIEKLLKSTIIKENE